MRLIRVQNFLAMHRQIIQQVESQIQIFAVCDDATTRYCILSHRWIEGQEVNYEQMKDLAKSDSVYEILNWQGYQKILKACSVADGLFEYLWVDTCCIDKRSSSELHDTTDFPTAPDTVTFAESHGWPQWFSRGWTLQELIAPDDLRFYNKDWTEIGNKRSKATELEQITRVPASVLKDGLSSYSPSFAEVMSIRSVGC